ncbi:Molybdopterin synthase sulfur carrier subunit [hydrothermal vent metagenome]|uniref:Molybdopterin synthase sulfur carrier subunit n=1 Tax=hydrothermal vent metagenome TaxID=652676 RepID=A0A3B0WS68_9ZZZZ
MSITVKFFARLREQVGKAEASLDSASNVQSAWDQATNGQQMPENTLCAVNMAYVDTRTVVNEGDEVAFFPPVTGGAYAQRS